MELDTNEIILLCILFITTCILVLIVKKVYDKFNTNLQTKIYLLFMNNNNSVFIHWQTLPDLLEHYNFNASAFISDIQLQTDLILIKSLVISWPTLKIKHKILGLETKLTAHKWINIYDAYKIKKIISEQFVVMIYVYKPHHGYKEIHTINK